jgi:hypothetical protein
MAGRPKKVVEDFIEPTLQVEEIEKVDLLEVEAIEEQKVEEVAVEPVVQEPTVKVSAYKETDIVEFYNNKGELRYAPYAYITKRGYTALRKYTKNR